MFDPKTNKYPYPEDTNRHYLEVKKDDGTLFDASYPYVDTSRSFKIRQSLSRILLTLIVFPVMRIRLGLRVEGRKNLKKHCDLLKKGVVSCCNHVPMWDFLGIMYAVRPTRPHVLVWAKNVSGENGPGIRLVGGIPIPENNPRATVSYIKAVRELIAGGGWLHIYPEGSMWEYYRPIRPFMRGAAFMAIDNDCPVLPLAYTYREPGWIRKHIVHQIALYTLHVGEPVFRDETLKGKEQEKDLTVRIHDEVCRLAGIDPEENIYPPVYDHSKRIDYYTTEYGVGYKGSW